jgi:hypothetical protein
MQKKTKKKKINTALAIHGKAKDGTNLVGIGNIRVFIVNEENSWFAQALEIDYAAQGKSLADVKKNFENGFVATIHEHLKVFGTITKLLKPAPQEVWAEVFSSGKKVKFYSQFSSHYNLPEALPFSGLDFYSDPETAKDAELVGV